MGRLDILGILGIAPASWYIFWITENPFLIAYLCSSSYARDLRVTLEDVRGNIPTEMREGPAPIPFNLLQSHTTLQSALRL